MQGDCLRRMKEIPDGSIDMVLADLPYGTTNCRWDSCISIEPLWKEYKRIIKRNGVIALFGSEPFSTKLRIGNLDWFKYDWIWHKTTSTGFVHAKNMPLKNYEIISVFSPASIGHQNLLGNKRMPYNPQGVRYVGKVSKTTKNKFGTIVGKRPSHKETFSTEYENYPKMVLEFKKEPKVTNPTQKPVALLEYLIRTYTNEGEIVLDNCFGSGSTGVACVKTNRNFIGIELGQSYFDIAKQRIEQTEGGSNIIVK